MNVRHPMGSFSIKNIFYDKMDLRLYFQMKIWRMQRTGLTKEKKTARDHVPLYFDSDF